jgi:hypothetical protein
MSIIYKYQKGKVLNFSSDEPQLSYLDETDKKRDLINRKISNAAKITYNKPSEKNIKWEGEKGKYKNPRFDKTQSKDLSNHELNLNDLDDVDVLFKAQNQNLTDQRSIAGQTNQRISDYDLYHSIGSAEHNKDNINHYSDNINFANFNKTAGTQKQLGRLQREFELMTQGFDPAALERTYNYHNQNNYASFPSKQVEKSLDPKTRIEKKSDFGIKTKSQTVDKIKNNEVDKNKLERAGKINELLGLKGNKWTKETDDKYREQMKSHGYDPNDSKDAARFAYEMMNRQASPKDIFNDMEQEPIIKPAGKNIVYKAQNGGYNVGDMVDYSPDYKPSTFKKSNVGDSTKNKLTDKMEKLKKAKSDSVGIKKKNGGIFKNI